jgi:hypothetical protein
MKGPNKPGYVLGCPTENDMAITIQRMKDWSIPPDRLILPFNDHPLRPINLLDDEHLALIEALVNTYRTPMVVIDSLRGGHDADENSSQVGKVVQRLASIAERTKAAIIVVHHTRKIPADEDLTANSSRGSNALLAMMRSQIGIDRPDPKSPWKRIRVLKENLGIAPKPVGFEVTDKGLVFGAAPEKPRKQKETGGDRAEQWLRARMQPNQQYPAATLIAEGEAAGFSHTGTLQRAKTALGVVTEKEGKHHYWRRPPSAEETQQPDGSDGPYVYAVSDGQAIKIGKSKHDPSSRMTELQNGNPRPLQLLAWTTALTEAQAHSRLEGYHQRGEWFRLTRAVLDEIEGWQWVNHRALAVARDRIAKVSPAPGGKRPIP